MSFIFLATWRDRHDSCPQEASWDDLTFPNLCLSEEAKQPALTSLESSFVYVLFDLG